MMTHTWLSLGVLFSCLLLASAELAYQKQTFTMDAFPTKGNGGVSSRGGPMPLPNFKNKLGIKYWGDWEVVDADTNKPMPVGTVFFHHITAFRAHKNGEREFLTGCSDDRRTLGAELQEGYLQLIDITGDKNYDITGYYHLVNLMPHQVKMAVRYTIVYVADEEVPAAGSNYTFVKAHFISAAYNVPGNGGPGSIHSYITEVTCPTTGRIKTAVGHLHQGAKNVTLYERATQQAIVTSEAIYAENYENDKCFYDEWCAQSGKPFTKNRVKDIQLVVGLDIPITRGTPWQMISYYDNGAEYRTVMAWVVLFVDESK